MAELARGSVVDRPWGLTFATLGLRGLSGQLTLTAADGKNYEVAFEHGAVVAAASPIASDAAVRVALTSGLVSTTQVAELARKQAAAPGRDEVDVIAEHLRLGPDHAMRLRRRTIAQRAARTFSIDRGDFIVTDDTTLPIVAGSALDVRAVIYLGARQNLSEARLAAELGQFGTWYRLRPEAVEDLPQFGFTDAERPILDALVNGAALAELDGLAEVDPRTVRAALYALCAANACSVEQTRGHGTSPPATKGSDSGVRRKPAVPAAARGKPTTQQPLVAYRPGVRRTGTTAAPPTGPAVVNVTPRMSATTGAPATSPGVARTTTPPPGVARTTTPPPGVARTTTPPSVARTTTPPPGVARTTTPPSVARATTPPSVARTTTPPPGVARTTPPTPRAPTATDAPASARTTTPPSVARTTTPPPGGARTTTAPTAGTPRAATSTGAPGRARTSTDRAATSSGRDAQPGADEVNRLIAARLALLDQGADHYALLGVEARASGDEIRKAYFQLARQLHPDKLAALGIADDAHVAHKVFAQLNTAFAVLSDPKRRAEYDHVLTRGGESALRGEQARAEEMAMRVLQSEEAFKRGELALKREDFGTAVSELARAIELNPDEPDFQALHAWAVFCATPDKSTIARQTRTTLVRAIEKSPRAINPRFYLGRVERMLGRDKEALELFKQVLGDKPHHFEAQSEVRAIEARLNTPPKGGGGLFGRKR